MKNPVYGVFFILFILFTIQSCSREEIPLPGDLPPTPVLTSDTEWGVVNCGYLKVLAQPDEDSIVKGILRERDIVEVISKKSAEGPDNYWMKIRSTDSGIYGWVKESSLNIYFSFSQARTASRNY